MPFFLHYKTPDGDWCPDGVYVPYRTVEEAKQQIANDTLDVALGGPDVGDLIHGLFEADYGRTPYGADSAVDPTGHLDPSRRKKVASASQLGKNLKKRRQALTDAAARAQADYVLAIELARRQGRPFLSGDIERIPKATVPGNAYSVCSGGTATAGAVALSAATAKTVWGIAAGANNAFSIVEMAVSFDGVTASAVPVLCEWVTGTNATNAPGTNSTSMTPKQLRGITSASVHTAAYNWTAEPTVLEVYKKRFLTPNGGLVIVPVPMGREPTSQVASSTQGKFMGLRLTAPATVNVHVDVEYEE